MKTLIIHHLEMTWESGYRDAGTSFYKLAKGVIKHIERAKYDRVILTQFENWKAQDEHDESGLSYLVDEWHEYGYGWELESILGSDLEEGKDYVTGGNHSDIVMIDDWMRTLKNDSVSICGAFDGECIEDLEFALNGCGVKFRRIEKLII